MINNRIHLSKAAKLSEKLGPLQIYFELRHYRETYTVEIGWNMVISRQQANT